MSPSRFKYWIGADGLAHIFKKDMPRPVIMEDYMPEGPMPSIKLRMRANPLYGEILAEVKAITGSDEIVIENEPGITRK